MVVADSSPLQNSCGRGKVWSVLGVLQSPIADFTSFGFQNSSDCQLWKPCFRPPRRQVQGDAAATLTLILFQVVVGVTAPGSSTAAIGIELIEAPVPEGATLELHTVLSQGFAKKRFKAGVSRDYVLPSPLACHSDFQQS